MQDPQLHAQLMRRSSTQHVLHNGGAQSATLPCWEELELSELQRLGSRSQPYGANQLLVVLEHEEVSLVQTMLKPPSLRFLVPATELSAHHISVRGVVKLAQEVRVRRAGCTDLDPD